MNCTKADADVKIKQSNLLEKTRVHFDLLGYLSIFVNDTQGLQSRTRLEGLQERISNVVMGLIKSEIKITRQICNESKTANFAWIIMTIYLYIEGCKHKKLQKTLWSQFERAKCEPLGIYLKVSFLFKSPWPLGKKGIFNPLWRLKIDAFPNFNMWSSEISLCVCKSSFTFICSFVSFNKRVKNLWTP